MLSLATKFVPHRPAFETAQKAGYRAAEFWSDADLLLQADQVAQVAADFPFRYAIHFPNHGRLTDDVLQCCVRLYQQLNCTAIIIHQPMFDRFAAELSRRLPEICLGVENHILDLNHFERWADVNPGLTLDVEHVWKFTLRDAPLTQLLQFVERFLNQHATKVQHVHLPGYVPGGEEHQPIHYSRQMAMEVISMLQGHGFSKLVVSEADTPFQTEEYLRQDIAMFEDWLSAWELSSRKKV